MTARSEPINGPAPRLSGITADSAPAVVASWRRGGPPTKVLVWACLWAVALIVAGVAVAIGAVVVLALGAPPWYPPVVAVTGLVGYTTTLGGLSAVRVAGLRWKLLGVATVALVLAMSLTVAVATV